MPPTLLIRDAEVAGRRVDVACADGVVTHIGAAPAGADVVIDAAGGALLPGLHDHHVHLLAMAAARDSVDVGTAGLAALRTAPGDDWVRAVGYHESDRRSARP